MTGIGVIAQQGAISTQVATASVPLAAAAPVQVEQAPPPPPPVESGRGTTVDTSA
ncbi:MAG: hypothetical protein WC612_01080 [Bdellovibrionales bacterium]|jgi:hypothetical protein